MYAPGSKDYIPIDLKLTAQPEIKAGKLTYPKSDTMTFGDEKVQVFEKPFRLTQEVTLTKSLKAGSTMKVAGTVHLQACDEGRTQRVHPMFHCARPYPPPPPANRVCVQTVAHANVCRLPATIPLRRLMRSAAC